MNFTISVLFRAIPLAMGAICLAYGWYLWDSGTDANSYVAGHVVTYLTIICIALFTTAATIIRQLINAYGEAYRVALPVVGYVAAAIGIIGGFVSMGSGTPEGLVAGHVVFGLGLITCCVATVALSSTKFILIPQNSKAGPGQRAQNAFSGALPAILLAIPIICALIAWIWGFSLLRHEAEAPYYVGGHVLAGIGFVCASLVALVASVLRQVQNSYGEGDRRFWPIFVIVMGAIDILWGLYVLIFHYDATSVAPGYVLIGLGIVCFSILSKVLLLALVWRQSYPLANRIPLIPVMTALLCLFIAAFLFEAGMTNPAYFVPARVMVGLGAICFTLFSIVSILESGTSS